MDSFEWNKIAGGVLAALIIVVLLREFGAAPYEVEAPHTRAYPVQVTEAAAPAAAEAGEAAGADKDVKVLLQTASAEAGAAVAKKCTSCHDLAKGGASKVGPAMWGVVGSVIGARAAGFGYSEAVKAKGAAGGVWGYEELFAWLKDPKAFIPGNKMAFAGISKAEERANLIAYLRTLHDNPPPLPGK